MVLYRRNRVAGGTYFFTVTLRDRSSDILVRHVRPLRDAFRLVRAQRPFTIDAIVILPDHLHTVWTLPDGDADYSGRWRAIKSHFTHELRATGEPLIRDNRGEYRLWQRRFWDIRFVTNAIMPIMLAIAIGILSSMAWCNIWRIGRFPRSTVTSGLACCHRIGRLVFLNRRLIMVKFKGHRELAAQRGWVLACHFCLGAA